MINPDPHRRLASCEAAAAHSFFAMAVSRPPVRTHATVRQVITPESATPKRHAPLQTKEAAGPLRQQASPQKISRSRERSKNPPFIVYEDVAEPLPSSSPAETKILAPKALALVERTNQPLKQDGVVAIPVAKTARAPLAPSRIPVRSVLPTQLHAPAAHRVNVPGVTNPLRKHQRVPSMPLASPKLGSVRPRVVSQPLLSQSSSNGKAPREGQPPPRAQTPAFSLKRKPPPTLAPAKDSSTAAEVICDPQKEIVRKRSTLWERAVHVSGEQKPCSTEDLGSANDEGTSFPFQATRARRNATESLLSA